MSNSTSGANGSDDVEELRHQIDQTRDELAETVEALAHKADVKSRAKEAVTDAKATAKVKAADAKLKLVDLRDQAKVTAVHDSEVARAKVTATHAQRPWLIPSIAAGITTLITTIWLLIRRKR